MKSYTMISKRFLMKTSLILCLLLLVSQINWRIPRNEEKCTYEEISFVTKSNWKKAASNDLKRVKAPTSHGRSTGSYDLVIFTSFKPSSLHHVMAHMLVILNWASFGRAIKPVLFVDMSDTKVNNWSDLVNIALQKGWDVLPIPSTNLFGTPHLKPMFEEVFKRYNASFFGYANGDLLFDDKLVSSLNFINTILKNELTNNALLVGKRTDIRLCSEALESKLQPESRRSNINTTSPLLHDALISHFDKSNLPELTRKGELREPFAIDYFFFTRDNSTFNWSQIANVVIGRRAYDQYLVAMAKRFQVNTVDLSEIVVAAHLSKPGTRDTGFINKDTDFNLNLIGKNFRYDDGLTSSTDYYLSADPETKRLSMSKRRGWFFWL